MVWSINRERGELLQSMSGRSLWVSLETTQLIAGPKAIAPAKILKMSVLL
jgi:hypothetical protein